MRAIKGLLLVSRGVTNPSTHTHTKSCVSENFDKMRDVKGKMSFFKPLPLQGQFHLQDTVRSHKRGSGTRTVVVFLALVLDGDEWSA
jgi:hypothetical protein